MVQGDSHGSTAVWGACFHRLMSMLPSTVYISPVPWTHDLPPTMTSELFLYLRLAGQDFLWLQMPLGRLLYLLAL